MLPRRTDEELHLMDTPGGFSEAFDLVIFPRDHSNEPVCTALECVLFAVCSLVITFGPGR